MDGGAAALPRRLTRDAPRGGLAFGGRAADIGGMTATCTWSVALACVAGVLGAPPARAQGWQLVDAPTRTSLRGVSTPTERVVWVSGARGTVARSIDGGRTWQLVSVPGADSLDFRDIEAFDARRALVLSIGNGAQSRIYGTTDGGATWTLHFTNPDSAAFYDCMAFWDASRGIAMSDPVDGRVRVLRTSDGGASWTPLAAEASPVALDGEAGFAASGTCLATASAGRAWIVTGGGPRARALRTTDFGDSWTASDITPIAAGAAPRGAFSVAVHPGTRLVATGGNYEAPTDTTGNVAISRDGGATWAAPRGPVPRGYRSGAAIVPGTDGRIVVAVGTSGTDYSHDGGEAWIAADTVALNAVSFASPAVGWAVGPGGRVVRWRGGFPLQRIRTSGKERDQ